MVVFYQKMYIHMLLQKSNKHLTEFLC